MIAFLRIFLYGFQGFKRNLWLSVIAIVTMTLTLTTMTIFILGDLVAVKKYQEFNQKIDYLIFIKDEPSEADVASFYAQVQNRPEVASSSLLSKEDVREKFEDRFEQTQALQGIISEDNNPLPREIDVKFSEPTGVDTFDSFVRQGKFQDLVEATSYQSNRGTIDAYLRTTSILRVIGLFFTIFFIVIAVLVILNTIRLAIFARREEIEIMRLVGATATYIRGPFLVEGSLFGVLGALFSSLIFWGILHQLQQVLVTSAAAGTTNFLNELLGSTFEPITTATGFSGVYAQVVVLQILIGLLLGLLCSFIAAHRYLQEK